MKYTIAFSLIFVLIMSMMFPFSVYVAAGESDVVIIANKGLPMNAMTRDEINLIFLAKKTHLDNGDIIGFVTLKKGRTHNVFLKKFLHKTPSQFQRYFKIRIFTGKGEALKSFDSEAEVVRYVAANEKTFGYVSANAVIASVKVIDIVD